MTECDSSGNLHGFDLTKYGQPNDRVLTRYRLIKHIGSGGFGDIIKFRSSTSRHQHFDGDETVAP